MIGLGLLVLSLGVLGVYVFYTVIKSKQASVVEKKILDFIYTEGKEVKTVDIMLKLNILPQELENRLINLGKRNMVVKNEKESTVSMTSFGTEYYRMKYRTSG